MFLGITTGGVFLIGSGGSAAQAASASGMADASEDGFSHVQHGPPLEVFSEGLAVRKPLLLLFKVVH